jgi:uncharacterized membrane protein
MTLANRLKSGFVAGLTLVAPLFITIVAFQLLFSWLRGIIDPIVVGTGISRYTGDLPYVAELIALVLLVLAVTMLGYVAQQRLGEIIFGLMDRGLARVPVFSVVYTGVRQVADALTSQQSRYERVAMLEYPRDGLYAIGFVTSESPVSVEDETGEETYNVYLPGSPNPTQGKFVLAPETELTELDMSVSQGIRLLVTTGIAEDRQGMAELQAEVDSHQPRDIEQALAPDGDDANDEP